MDMIEQFLEKLAAVCKENNIELTDDLFVVIIELLIFKLLSD